MERFYHIVSNRGAKTFCVSAGLDKRGNWASGSQFIALSWSAVNKLANRSFRLLITAITDESF